MNSIAHKLNQIFKRTFKDSSRAGFFVIALVVIVVLFVSSLALFRDRINPTSGLIDKALASYVSYEGGQASIDTTFVNQVGDDVPSLISLTSSQATVRFHYANTGNLQAQNASINSTLPNGFAYIPGTLRNVYNDIISVPLQDGLFLGTTLSVSPSAGLYNSATNASSGILDIGKVDYLRVQKCSVVSGFDELFAASTNTQSLASNNSEGNTCSSNVTGSFLTGFSIPLLNNRYLKSIECQPSSGPSETFVQYASNTIASSNSDSTGNICGSTGQGSFVSVRDIDLLAGRYARTQRCDHPTNEDEFLLAPTLYATELPNNDSSGNSCSTAYPNSAFISANNIDLRDPSNSGGYIEFQVTLPSSSGCKNIVASLISTSFATVTNANTCGIRVQEGQTAGDGILSISKNYDNGVSLVNSATISVGGTVKVRLNYSNTSSQAIRGLSLNDTYDSNAFSFEPDSGKNCYSGADVCTSLDNSLFATTPIKVAPGAGILGYASNAQASSLEQGRKRFVQVIQCFNGSHYDTFAAESSDSASPVTGNCQDYGLSGYTKTATFTVDTLGKRYLNMVTCQKDGYYDTFPAAASNAPGQSVALCNTFGLTGYGESVSFGVDLREVSNLNLKRCSKNGNVDTYISEATNTLGASNTSCYNSGTTGYTNYSGNGGFGIFILNKNNAFGHIEYRLRAKNTVTSGVFGTNATLTQASGAQGQIITSMTAPSTSALQISLYCDSVTPVGEVRSVGLSDAELRTDQDFTCNYQAQICPVIFQDTNLSATKDFTETLYNGIIVSLRRASDNSLVTTLTTDSNAAQPQCFNNLASGEGYIVTVTNPPSLYSTTQGDSVVIESSLLVLQQQVFFGYSNGGIILAASPEVFFPGTTVSSVDQNQSTTIPYVSVRDQRQGTLPWSVSGVVTNFTGLNFGKTLPISNRLALSPQSITITQGQQNIIRRGSNYTVTSSVDAADIFDTGSNDGSGQYSVDVNLNYSVPSYTTVDTYKSIMTFTLI